MSRRGVASPEGILLSRGNRTTRISTTFSQAAKRSRRNQTAVKLQAVVDHAFGGEALAGAGVGQFGIGAAHGAVFVEHANIFGEAGGSRWCGNKGPRLPRFRESWEYRWPRWRIAKTPLRARPCPAVRSARWRRRSMRGYTARATALRSAGRESRPKSRRSQLSRRRESECAAWARCVPRPQCRPEPDADAG